LATYIDGWESKRASTASAAASDGIRDAALIRRAALRERLRESMEIARATGPRAAGRVRTLGAKIRI
jgi:hypothetical protein